MPTSTQHLALKPTSLFTLYCIIFLGSAGFFITIPAYVSLFLTDHSLAIAQNMSIEQRRTLFGTVMSAAPFISMFFTPFIARFADRFSRKMTMVLCLIIAAIGFAIPIYAIVIGSIALLFAGNMINSLGSASQPIAQAILADNSRGKTKATLMSMVAIVMTAAMSFGPALGSKLSATYGTQAPFYACLIIAIFCLVLLNLVRLPPQVTLHNENPLSFVAPLKRSQSGLLACLAIVFICQFSWSLYFQNIAFIFPQKWGISVESSFYQYFMMAIGVVMICSLLLLPRLILARINVLSALRITTLFAAIGMILLAVTPTPNTHIAAMIFTAVMVAIAFPFYITALSDRASEADQGWVMAMSSAMVGLAWTLSGYLTSVFVNIDLILPTAIAAIGYVIAMIIVPKKAAKLVTAAN
ncbi:MFS transporter [Photobacterium toruni]|uniref:Major Facilitator Superfamily protein n=1 Tax=Photobacterium toruni TaxID=1935446 RepID=A0A1T4T1I8_9GAMM|nr:MFS transporter [Photobacterium toruni]SKA34111.1 Major Facilitator Superfamily protein [Photobacterium toruni]